MGSEKLVVYIPREYLKDMLAALQGKPLKVTLEEALN